MRSLLVVVVVCASFPYGCADPYISPGGYNASLSEGTVQFRCITTSDTDNIVWYINEKSAAQLGEEILAEQGVTYSDTLVTDGDVIYVVINVETSAKNDNTTLECLVVFTDAAPARSEGILLRIQGLLAPPTALLTEQHTSTHDVLMWEDPYTLNLTAVDPDITGYTITITMSDPPPHYPYDLPLTLDQLTDTRNQTFTISSAEGQKFPFPRYAFPVWLSVRAENPAGLGDPSQHFRYTAQLLDDCMRINDLVPPHVSGKVMFIDSTPSVEIVLFQLSQSDDVKYCFDTVEVMITASDDITSSSLSHVLVPILSETEVSVVLEPGLEEDTHFTATLSFNSQQITTTTFSTYAVQDISVSVLPNGLTVQCHFAEGSTQTVCTVVLELDGMKNRMESFTGAMTFSGLAIGSYTLLAYDETDMEGSGYEMAAVQRTVEITGVTLTPTTSDGTTSATVPHILPTPSPTADEEEEEEEEEGPSSGFGTHTLLVVIAVVVVCVVFILLIITLSVVKWVRNRSATYPIRREEELQEKRESKRISATNPIPEDPETVMTVYSSNPTAGEPEERMENPYEVVDADQARERAKKKEVKVAPPPAPPQSVYTEEELKEIKCHVYTTVQKDKSGKRKAERKDSSPPPIPPQTFDYQKEFAEEVQSPAGEEEGTDPSPVPDTNTALQTHIYDSLSPTTTSAPPSEEQPKSDSEGGKVTDAQVCNSISDVPAGNPSPNPSPSHAPSPFNEGEDSRLLQSSPTLPPRASTDVSVDENSPHPVTSQHGSLLSEVGSDTVSDTASGGAVLASQGPQNVHGTHLFVNSQNEAGHSETTI